MVMRTLRFEIVEEGPKITNGSMRGLWPLQKPPVMSASPARALAARRV